MRFEKLDLNLLVALDALIEEVNVSNAARRLRLSQPAMSSALARLRAYFGDQLLVGSGRRLVLTRRAEELRAPVREALTLIGTRITTPEPFDPATSERSFTIVASDYSYDVLLAGMFAAAARVAPKVRFEMLPHDQGTAERLDWREIDVLIAIGRFLTRHQPSRFLFADEHAVIAWTQGRHGDGVDADAFFAAGHAAVVFGPERRPDVAEAWFEQQSLSRSIEVRLPSFAALPQAVIGTDRLAVMNRRHAEHFARLLPIAVHAPPVPLPGFEEHAQWHGSRTGDAGLAWLLDLLASSAASLSSPATTDRKRGY